MVYDGSGILERTIRIGFSHGANPLNRLYAVLDAAADWLARRNIVVVADYRSPASVAACRHAGSQVVICRSDWKPKNSGKALRDAFDVQPVPNPVPAGRVWDERWDRSLQAVVTSSNPLRAVEVLSTHVLTAYIYAERTMLALRCPPGRKGIPHDGRTKEGDVCIVWTGSETTLPALLNNSGIA